MPKEITSLSPREEVAFRNWAIRSGIEDVDAPGSFYDYRGYWKDVASQGKDQTQVYPDGIHFPDTYKQHGHPTFSIESKYSKGPYDGGMWVGEEYVPQINPVPAHVKYPSYRSIPLGDLSAKKRR